MHEIINQTPFEVEVIPGLNKEGYDFVVVVMKATFHIPGNQHQLTLSDIQTPIIRGSIYYGESNNSSIQYESDIAFCKQTTDIVLNGQAYSPQGKPAPYVDVVLKVNELSCNRRVFGNRYWTKSEYNWGISPAERFERLPLHYENAYGGGDLNSDQENAPTANEYNPIGKGYIAPSKKQPEEGQALPNIENPSQLIQHWQDRPTPVGFGFISSQWQPRMGFAGTYDEQWKKNRLPLLPNDFNERYFHSAHPDLMSAKMLLGGEIVSIKNVTPSGLLEFQLPILDTVVSVKMHGKNKSFLPMLDTILIEPDRNCVQLTSRVTVPCSRKFLYIDSITVSGKDACKLQ